MDWSIQWVTLWTQLCTQLLELMRYRFKAQWLIGKKYCSEAYHKMISVTAAPELIYTREYTSKQYYKGGGQLGQLLLACNWWLPRDTKLYAADPP